MMDESERRKKLERFSKYAAEFRIAAKTTPNRNWARSLNRMADDMNLALTAITSRDPASSKGGGTRESDS